MICCMCRVTCIQTFQSDNEMLRTRLSCRICWAAFSSEGFSIRTYSYQILQYSPSYGTQVTPVTPVGLSTSTIVTGLQLEEAYTYFIKVRCITAMGGSDPGHVPSIRHILLIAITPVSGPSFVHVAMHQYASNPFASKVW